MTLEKVEVENRQSQILGIVKLNLLKARIQSKSTESTGIFLVLSGAKFRPHSRMNFGNFPNFEKIPIFKKNFFFVFEGQSPHTQATW